MVLTLKQLNLVISKFGKCPFKAMLCAAEWSENVCLEYRALDAINGNRFDLQGLTAAAITPQTDLAMTAETGASLIAEPGPAINVEPGPAIIAEPGAASIA